MLIFKDKIQFFRWVIFSDYLGGIWDKFGVKWLNLSYISTNFNKIFLESAVLVHICTPIKDPDANWKVTTTIDSSLHFVESMLIT
jgi:hypothetical protein